MKLFLKRKVIYSFLIQKGLCRYCKEKINSSYFYVELISGVTAIVFFLLYSSSLSIDFVDLSFKIIIAYFFIYLGYYDYLYWEVPIKSLMGISAIVLIYLIVRFVFGVIVLNTLLWFIGAGIIGVCSIIILIYFSKGKGLGWGDAWVFGLVGLALGPKDLFVAYSIAVFSGAIIGIIKAIKIRKFHGVLIQFVPFISLGVIVALLENDWIFGLIFPYFDWFVYSLGDIL